MCCLDESGLRVGKHDDGKYEESIASYIDNYDILLSVQVKS